MQSYFLPAAFVAVSFFVAAATVNTAEGYSGLIADDSATSSSPSNDSGGYGGLIAAPSSSPSQTEEEPSVYSNTVSRKAPEPAAKATATNKRKPVEAKPKEETQTPRDIAQSVQRLKAAATQEGFKNRRKESSEKLRNTYRLSPESIRMIYKNPVGQDGKTVEEKLMDENISFYMNQVNDPNITPEKRKALAVDAYEQLSVFATGMGNKVVDADSRQKEFLDAGASQENLDAVKKSQANAYARLREAMKIIEPLQK